MHAGYLSEAEALVHPDRHLVPSGIGVEGMTPEVGPNIRLARHDTVVLASDGLTDNVYESEIVEALRKGPLVEQLNGLVELTRGRMAAADDSVDVDTGELAIGKPDDLTVIAIRRR